VTSMHMEVRALFGRFVWRGVNIDDVTIPILPEARGSIPHWSCANSTGSHTLQHQPKPGLSEPRPGQPTAGQTRPRKVPRSQHRPSLITPPRFKFPAHSDAVNRWNFRKADWKRFCLLTGESIMILPPPDTPDSERAYQDFCESLLSAAK